MKTIEQFIESDKSKRIKIAVVGDLLIDEYYYVDANRVSPEFPIPVMRSDLDIPLHVVPGGAGNVCAQFRDFNVDVNFYGLIDSYGKKTLRSVGISTDNCVFQNDNRFKTPIKRRFYQGQFPLCRWDIESANFGIELDVLKNLSSSLYKKYRSNDRPDVLILSDYSKGTFTEMQRYLPAEPELITIVDPKNSPLETWQGCTIFKPNSKEAEKLSGCSDWHNQCDFFQDKLGCCAVVITHGGECVVGKVGESYFEHKSCNVKEANSVIGAGDCFIAFLAMMVGRGIDIISACKLAFEAGAIYVQKKYNAPVKKYELLQRINPFKAKFTDPAELADRDYKLIWTNGCFDILHEGHLNILRVAKSKGDKLIVGVDVDESITKMKGPDRPVNSLQERMNMLAALEDVDFVVPFANYDPTEAIKACQPDAIVKGGDWEDKVIGADLVKEVHIVPRTPQSTTDIIKKIRG